MKLEALKRRLDKRRPMTAISMRFPADVIEDLKRVAPLRGFTGYQPLIRAYVGQGLREDLEQLEEDPVAVLVENLKRRGVRGRHRGGAYRGRPEVTIERPGSHRAPAEIGPMRADTSKMDGYCRAAGPGGRSLQSARCE